MLHGHERAATVTDTEAGALRLTLALSSLARALIVAVPAAPGVQA